MEEMFSGNSPWQENNQELIQTVPPWVNYLDSKYAPCEIPSKSSEHQIGTSPSVITTTKTITLIPILPLLYFQGLYFTCDKVTERFLSLHQNGKCMLFSLNN